MGVTIMCLHPGLGETARQKDCDFKAHLGYVVRLPKRRRRKEGRGGGEKEEKGKEEEGEGAEEEDGEMRKGNLEENDTIGKRCLFPEIS